MKFSNKKNMLIASALAGAILFSPMANTNVAYADDRPQIWGGLIGDDPHYFKLEPTSIKHLTVKGIHYISVWAVNLTEGGGSAWIPIAGMYAKDKAGYVNFIIKFEEDGTYHAEKMYYSKAKKLKNVMAFSDEKMEQDWISLLNYRYDEKNDNNYLNHQGEDIFNPRNWHYTGKKFQQSITDESARSIVEYLQQNHPEIIAEHIAANKRDEATALKQHEVELAQKEQAHLAREAAKQAVVHNQLLEKFRQNRNSQTITNNIKNLGEYSWDMFLDSPDIPHPDIDINHLIHNTWYLDVIGQGQGYGHNEIVSFKPVFWYVGDTMLEDSSLLEMNTLSEQGYNPDGSYSQNFDKENFSLELARYDGTFSPNISFTSREPENGSEKKIIRMDTVPGEGDYKTVGGSTRTYRFKPGMSNDDFWLIEYEGWNENARATGVSYHLTKMN